MKTILFDIDGTLANIEHRRNYVAKDKPDWKSFNAEMGGDIPNAPIVALYKSLWASDAYELILVTGRNERSRVLTEQWLAWNEIPFDQILMRPDNDFRADHIIKEEILNHLLAAGKAIEFVVDDLSKLSTCGAAMGSLVCNAMLAISKSGKNEARYQPIATAIYDLQNAGNQQPWNLISLAKEASVLLFAVRKSA